MIIIWLAKFASFDWSIPGPITYGTDPDGHLLSFVFASFVRCLAVFTNEITLFLTKEAFGLRLDCFET